MAAYLRMLQLPLGIISAIAASLSGLLYWKQNELIYPRNIPPGSRAIVPRPRDFPQYDFHESTEELDLLTPDGEHISAFLLKPQRKKRYYNRNPNDVTIIMFHGNAGNIGHRIDIAGCLQLSIPANILMVEYRGYGLSTGMPDERGLNIDAQTALDFVKRRSDLQQSMIVIYGQSLGGAVAIQLAINNKHQSNIKAIILENTFLSVRKLVPSYVESRISPFLHRRSHSRRAFPPAKFLAPLCHQYWNSEEILPKLTPSIPALFLSGGQDEIVPYVSGNDYDSKS